MELNFPNPVETRADLFDREQELGVVQETLRSSTRRPVVIMGERVMGKTSLLNVVVEWVTGQDQLTVLQLPHVGSREAFVEEVLDGIAAQARTSLHQLGLRDERGRLRISTVTDFARVAGELAGAGGGQAFVLCLDELDSMLVNCPDDTAANQILDLILHVVGRTTLPVKFVFTLTRTASRILRSDASPFLSAARIVRLAPWTPERTRAFVDRLVPAGSALDGDGHDLLYASGGGHPYLTKAVLRSLLDDPDPDRDPHPDRDQDRDPHPDRRRELDRERVRAAVAATITSPEVDFTLENIAKVHFSADELGVLRRIAAAVDPMHAGALAAPPGVLHELRQRRYLRVDPDGRYRQSFGLLGEWLKCQPWLDHPPPGAAAGPAGASAQPYAGPYGDPPALVIDDDRKRVFFGPDELQLTAQEYRFLNCLAAHAGTVVDRSTVASEVWAEEVLAGGVREGRLDALVYRLREELGTASGYVETRRGRGFYVSPEHVRRVTGGAP
jgi:hypothetical protein